MYGRSSDLSRLLRLPNMMSVAKECNKHIVAKELTAAGTVPDFHRIPVNPSPRTDSETVTTDKGSAICGEYQTNPLLIEQVPPFIVSR